MKVRDMSETQFRAALKRHGMRRTGVMGYIEMCDGHLSVSLWNTAGNRRAQLAYLLREKERYELESEQPIMVHR